MCVLRVTESLWKAREASQAVLVISPDHPSTLLNRWYVSVPVAIVFCCNTSREINQEPRPGHIPHRQQHTCCPSPTTPQPHLPLSSHTVHQHHPSKSLALLLARLLAVIVVPVAAALVAADVAAAVIRACTGPSTHTHSTPTDSSISHQGGLQQGKKDAAHMQRKLAEVAAHTRRRQGEGTQPQPSDG